MSLFRGTSPFLLSVLVALLSIPSLQVEGASLCFIGPERILVYGGSSNRYAHYQNLIDNIFK